MFTSMEDSHSYKTLYCANCGFQHKVRLYCGDRLCEICKEPNYHRLLSHYLPVVEKIKPYRLQQITLTHRNCQFLTKSKIDKIASDLRKLRKSVFFKSRVKGGLAVVECKHRNDKVGWNIHIHILVDSSFIPVKELSKVWLSITGNSFIVDVRNEGDSRGSLFHLLKYFLKTPVILGADILNLKEDFNNAFRGFRSLITFGSLYNWKADDDVYHFKCPSCKSVCWIRDDELDKFSDRAIKIKGRSG